MPKADVNWPDHKTEQLKALWARGESASEVAATLLITRNAVLGKVFRLGLTKRRPTPVRFLSIEARQAVHEQRIQDRQAALDEKKKAKELKARRLLFVPKTSKTSAVYRRALPRMPETSKGALLAMLAEAVRNTNDMAAAVPA